MPTIDFYILEISSRQKCWHFACQFIEKAYLTQQQAYVLLPSSAEAEQFDTLLWTYRDDSFVPHSLYTSSDEMPPPVQIGHAAPPSYQKNLLINLTPEIPPFYTQFNQIIEIVFSDPLVQQLARERYKQYRDQGHGLNTHKIKAHDI